ncbi:hypothetical protein DSO57_1027552 [Entomophthora muscae]|uniref:Uncharacterized protein n=1 Tax=Entomophthora muscae TaxID=34485 RepID=A0ACC2TP79_9FUNG|nr:hypothetical protein DSO57_1027552 [Entomophthora muscae]
MNPLAYSISLFTAMGATPIQAHASMLPARLLRPIDYIFGGDSPQLFSNTKGCCFSSLIQLTEAQMLFKKTLPYPEEDSKPKLSDFM